MRRMKRKRRWNHRCPECAPPFGFRRLYRPEPPQRLRHVTEHDPIRRRNLAKLLRTLRALRRNRQRLWKRDTLLRKLGAAHEEAGKAWNFM
jgi:hypothetical protein